MVKHYAVYHTNHPARTVQGGTTIIIKNFINHPQLNNYSQNFLQATSVWVSTISAGYLPPKYTAKQEQFQDFYNTPGHCFTAGGDYNTDWRSTLTTPKGCELLK
jgi:hypothetical protein